MKTIVLNVILLFGIYLGVHENNIALWQTGQPDPLEVYPYSVSLYTNTDQQYLKQGIPILESSEVTKHLDDYLS